jgi:hypothetical protein
LPRFFGDGAIKGSNKGGGRGTLPNVVIGTSRCRILGK